MKIDSKNLAKADESLRIALEQTEPEETLQGILVLEPKGGSTEGALKRPERRDFESQEEYRQALIDQRQAELAEQLGPTLQALRGLGLGVSGGELGRTVVVRGTASNLLAALDIPGVGKASLDQSISIPANITKAQWVRLQGEVRALATRVLDLTGQTATLKGQAGRLEQLAEKAMPRNRAVTWAKWLVGIVVAGTVLTAVVLGIWTLASVSADVRVQEQRLKDLEAKQHVMNLLLKSHRSGTDASEGNVVRVDKGKVVIEAKGQEKSFRLAAHASVTLHGEPARLTDVKPGMRVRVWVSKDEVDEVSAVEAEPSE